MALTRNSKRQNLLDVRARERKETHENLGSFATSVTLCVKNDNTKKLCAKKLVKAGKQAIQRALGARTYTLRGNQRKTTTIRGGKEVEGWKV